jgi:hypothetical protein
MRVAVKVCSFKTPHRVAVQAIEPVNNHLSTVQRLEYLGSANHSLFIYKCQVDE